MDRNGSWHGARRRRISRRRLLAAAGVSTAVLDQVLEVQQQLAAQLLQSMGVGGKLDLFV